MHWKVNFNLKYPLFILIVSLIIFMVLLSGLVGFALYDEYQQKRQEAIAQAQQGELQKEALIQKMPLYKEDYFGKTKRLITYTISNKPLFQKQILITIQDVDGQKEEPVFIGDDKMGIPKWLDNEHIFFTSYCGTACKGIYLLDVRNKETKLATLSFTFADANSWETHFHDWFGQDFQFPGLLGEIGTESSNGNYYLVFHKKEWTSSDEGKKLLFTGDTLAEQ